MIVTVESSKIKGNISSSKRLDALISEKFQKEDKDSNF